jgi:biotin operon repressor
MQMFSDSPSPKTLATYICGDSGPLDDFNPFFVTRQKLVPELLYALNEHPLSLRQISSVLKINRTEASKIAELLQQMGFSIELLGSEKCVSTKLQTLTDSELAVIREAFIKHAHPRFLKYFFCHMPFGRKKPSLKK